MKSDLEIVANLQEKIEHLEWHNEKMGHARAFVITSCVSWLRQKTTYFHYPSFYLIHHALELLLKNIFHINWDTSKSHYLMNLFNKLSEEDKKKFTKEELSYFEISDALNADRGQLRYLESPHKQFDPNYFSGLVSVAYRLLKE
jgi:hypothetical protein